MKKEFVFSLLGGLAFLGLGMLLLLQNFFPGIGNIFGLLWPAFVLLPGIGLWAIYFSAEKKEDLWGVTIPATILTLLSGMFFFNVFFERIFRTGFAWEISSFAYPLIVAASFVVAYFAGKRKEKAILIPAGILAFVSVLILFFTTISKIVSIALPGGLRALMAPMFLIGIGLIIILAPFAAMIFGKKFNLKSEQEWESMFEKIGRDIEKAFGNVGKSIEKVTAEVEESVKQSEVIEADEIKPKKHK